MRHNCRSPFSLLEQGRILFVVTPAAARRPAAQGVCLFLRFAARFSLRASHALMLCRMNNAKCGGAAGCNRCILVNTMSTSILTLRLDAGLKKQLEKLAQATQRSKSFLAAEAIREYVALNDWQIEEIRKAVKEADRGDFASPGEVRRVMKKWTRTAG